MMQSSFTGGELSPLAAARMDAERYYQSAATMENLLPIPQGPALRRPGTVFAAATDGNDAARLIPFRYSADDVYCLEFTPLLMRVYRSGGLVTNDDDTIYSLVTPFDANEIAQIQCWQSADILYLVDGTDWPQVLIRADHNDWSIADADIDDGPFLTENLTDVTIAADGTTGDVNLVASGEVFEADHVGGFWRLRDLVEIQTVTGSFTDVNDSNSLTLQAGNNFQWSVSGTWVGTCELQISYDDGATWTAYTVITSTGSAATTETVYDNDTGQDLLLRAACTAYTSGTVQYTIWVHAYMHVGVVQITAVTDPCTATAEVVRDLASTDATVRWSEGAWSPYRGYPAAIAGYSDRLVLASTTHQPLTIWMSATGQYTTFDTGAGDDADAFGYSLGLSEQDPILWLAAQRRRGLLVGTTGSVIEIEPTDATLAITPSNLPTVTNTLAMPCADIEPVVADNILLVLQRGGRKLREVLYSYDADALVAPDLTLFAEHVTAGGVTAMAWTGQPYTILWSARADGQLLAMTYDRNYQVVGWSRHPLGGDGVVESLCSTPTSTGEDRLWLAVRRTVDGGTVRYVEYLSPWDWGTDQNDVLFVDCSLSYDGAAATTFSGLGHLEGETVSVCADGAALADVAVDGGEITLDDAASIVHVGYPYTSTLATVRYDIAAEDGSTWGKNKSVTRAMVSFYQTLGAKIGPDAGHMVEPSWQLAGEPIYGGVPDLFSGDRQVTLASRYDSDRASLRIVQERPWPMTVRAVVATVQVR